MQDTLAGNGGGVDGGGVELVAVGFSGPDRLAGVADHLGWRGRFLADTERRLYRDLGLGRAPWWRVYSPGTVLVYLRAALPGRLGRRVTGQRTGATTEDTRQLGGDALVRDGRVVTRWNPRSPDDRVDPTEILRAVRGATRGG